MKELDNFTVERLERIAERRSGIMPTMREIAALARIAIAAKTADENCARLEVNVGGNTWIECSTEAFNRRKDAGDMVRRLYEEPVLNSPELPDGWILVSERMPVSQEWVIVFAKWANQQVLCWDGVAGRWTDFEDQTYYADMFTHWQPLPAPPKE